MCALGLVPKKASSQNTAQLRLLKSRGNHKRRALAVGSPESENVSWGGVEIVWAPTDEANMCVECQVNAFPGWGGNCWCLCLKKRSTLYLKKNPFYLMKLWQEKAISANFITVIWKNMPALADIVISVIIFCWDSAADMLVAITMFLRLLSEKNFWEQSGFPFSIACLRRTLVTSGGMYCT